jgi:hypothetical protein
MRLVLDTAGAGPLESQEEEDNRQVIQSELKSVSVPVPIIVPVPSVCGNTAVHPLIIQPAAEDAKDDSFGHRTRNYFPKQFRLRRV